MPQTGWQIMNVEMENWKNHWNEMATYLVNMTYLDNQLCFVCGNERVVDRSQDSHTFLTLAATKLLEIKIDCTPPEILHFISCQCKKGSVTNLCSCKRHGLSCVPAYVFISFLKFC